MKEGLPKREKMEVSKFGGINMLPKIIRNNSLSPFRVFDDFFDGDFAPMSRRSGWGHREVAGMLKMDVKEKDGNYIVDVDLPGCKKEDISLDLKDGYLTITATRNNEVDEKDEGGYIRRERFVGQCSRTVEVGDVKPEDVKAKFESGVLTLTFPKEAAEKPATQTIAIEG